MQDTLHQVVLLGLCQRSDLRQDAFHDTARDVEPMGSAVPFLLHEILLSGFQPFVLMGELFMAPTHAI